jgi:hypothetical protein
MRFDRSKRSWWLLAMTIAFVMAVRNHAQQVPMGHASGFTTDMYYEQPHEQQVQMRLSGSEALPDGSMLNIKDLKIEYYNTNGVKMLLARAPQCTYAPLDNQASSPGHLDLDSGDGKFHIEGEGFGFIFQQTNSSLTLSNRVHTVLEAGMLKL